MESFILSCETCHTRLRVRDQRVVGQIHACPKCGSMVQIALPAGLAASNLGAASPTQQEFSAPAAELIAVSPTADGAGVAVQLASAIGRHAMLWSTAGAALVVAIGLAGSALLRSGEQVAAHPASASTSTATTQAADLAAIAGEEIESAAPDSQEVPAHGPPTAELPVAAARPILPELPPDDAAADESRDNLNDASVKQVNASAATPSTDEPAAAQTPSHGDQPLAQTRRRTLELDAIPVDPTASRLNAPPIEVNDATAYPPLAEELEKDHQVGQSQSRAGSRAADRPSPVGPPKTVNLAGQLSLRIESVEMPAMPLESCIKVLSDMAAVPMTLDAAVSPQIEVTVREQDVTLGELLTSLLAEHALAWEARNGEIVITARPPTTDP